MGRFPGRCSQEPIHEPRGERLASPSVRVDLLPDGAAEVLATHEQELGGEDGQVHVGCRFPASPAYAPELARHGRRVGEALARAGAVGRFALDLVAVADGGAWRVVGLEVNLRKGGARAYAATDNMVDPGWTGLAPAEVIGRVRAAGLQFDPHSGTGVVLLMFSGLLIDGRFAAAIGRDEAEAESLMSAVPSAVGSPAGRPAGA